MISNKHVEILLFEYLLIDSIELITAFSVAILEKKETNNIISFFKYKYFLMDNFILF